MWSGLWSELSLQEQHQDEQGNFIWEITQIRTARTEYFARKTRINNDYWFVEKWSRTHEEFRVVTLDEDENILEEALPMPWITDWVYLGICELRFLHGVHWTLP